MRTVSIIRMVVVAGLALTMGRVALADEPAPLKQGAGAETTANYCGACHTTDYIVMNSVFLTPATWKAEVTKMRNAFGAPMEDQVAEEITAYLAANYATEGK